MLFYSLRSSNLNYYVTDLERFVLIHITALGEPKVVEIKPFIPIGVYSRPTPSKPLGKSPK